MFKLDENTRVFFRHLPPKDPQKHKKVTMAVIEMTEKREDGTEIVSTFQDYALCSISDNFCKATGRLISLTRVLSLLPRELRTKIWKEYFNRSPIKNHPTIVGDSL